MYYFSATTIFLHSNTIQKPIFWHMKSQREFASLCSVKLRRICANIMFNLWSSTCSSPWHANYRKIIRRNKSTLKSILGPVDTSKTFCCSQTAFLRLLLTKKKLFITRNLLSNNIFSRAHEKLFKANLSKCFVFV